MKNCSNLATDPDSLRSLHGLARERLKELGISVSRHQKSKLRHFPATPGRKTASNTPKTPQNVFGRPLRDLAPSSVILDENSEQLLVPHFLVAILNWLRGRLETDGLFRKAGSAGRQRGLRAEIEEAETFFVEEDNEEVTVSALDIGSLLKQWLRELPEPLIPLRFQDTYLKCCKLTGETKSEAVLSACLLLPPLHAASLTVLMRFLAQVAQNSIHNKMDSRSLAIVFTPCLFPVSDSATNLKKVGSTNADLANKLEIVETLIKNATKVCMIDQPMEDALSIPVLLPTGSEDNLSDDEDYESYAGGPSARRMKSQQKKKRRSGSLSRVFTAFKGIQKAIRSTTPAGHRSASSDTRSDFSSSAAQTPIFQSPRLPAKGKVEDEPDHMDGLSPNSKHRKAALESAFTPKVMGVRSVSIKNRFKREKSLTDGAKFKEPSLVIRRRFDGNGVDSNSVVKTPSLPSKPRLSSITNTPGTPGSVNLQANQDLSGDNLEDEVVEVPTRIVQQSASARSSKSSLGSIDSIASTKSYPGRVTKRRSSERKFAGKPRSPGERKIGVVRRRSQEIERKKALLREDKKKNLKDLPILDESYVRNQLKRGRPNTFRAKPSPMKVEKATPDGRKTTRIKISFRDGQLGESPKVEIRGGNPNAETSREFKVNESLTNLRQDISSMIEKSFGPFQDPDDPEVTFGKFDNAGEQTDKFTLEELTCPKLPSSLLTRSMRRQSSAFEMKTNAGMGQVRRQSSAYELQAWKKNQNSFDRGVSTRASLKQRNSSVKDLVKKLEVKKTDDDVEVFEPEAVFKMPSPPKETPMKKTPLTLERGRPRTRIPIRSPTSIADAEEAKDDFPTSNESEWMDANDFFNKPSRVAHLAFEDTSGCKRSSIIRIRTEKKGLVSRSVETFTKPALPPPIHTPRRVPRPPARTPASCTVMTSSTRRTSARMGVAGKSLANGTMVTRRQTLTGIKTSAMPNNENSKRLSNINKRPLEEPIYDNIDHQVPVQAVQAKKPEPKHSHRRSKRIEGRRFLTIGYDGEVRTPLKEKKNTILDRTAKVQRSKSAQTPSNPKKIKKKQQMENDKENNEIAFCQTVQRSLSLRSPRPQIVVPDSLRETIYDVTTPKSEKVRRHLSDRVMTPKGGRQEAVPFIKEVLTVSRSTPHAHGLTPRLPKRKSPRLAHL